MEHTHFLLHHLKEMEKLLPVREPISFVPESYIHQTNIRPGTVEFPVYKDIPVTDLAELDHDRTGLVNKLVKAGQDIDIFFVSTF